MWKARAEQIPKLTVRVDAQPSLDPSPPAARTAGDLQKRLIWPTPYGCVSI